MSLECSAITCPCTYLQSLASVSDAVSFLNGTYEPRKDWGAFIATPQFGTTKNGSARLVEASILQPDSKYVNKATILLRNIVLVFENLLADTNIGVSIDTAGVSANEPYMRGKVTLLKKEEGQALDEETYVALAILVNQLNEYAGPEVELSPNVRIKA